MSNRHVCIFGYGYSDGDGYGDGNGFGFSSVYGDGNRYGSGHGDGVGNEGGGCRTVFRAFTLVWCNGENLEEIVTNAGVIWRGSLQ